MFGAGSSTFGGFGQNNNTTTPQQTNQSFGAFGNTAAGGQTNSIFGQPQQQSGAANNNTFGGFGTSSNPPQAASGFGGFGAATPQQSNTGSFGFGTNSSPAFGTPSGGLFGSTSQNTATPAFGSQPSNSIFGSANTTAPQSTPFGSSNVFGGNNPQIITNGSSNPPFSVFSEKEPAGSGTNHFQSITCMPAYSNVSFEELRVQDYNQNRRYGAAAPMSGSFGSGPFAAGNNSNVFGSQQQNSTFGQSQPTSGSTNSIFGQKTNTQPNVFGSTGNAVNSFGQPQTNNLFGSSNTGTIGAQSNPGGSIFGSGNGATSTPFGSTNATTTNTAFGSGSANPFGGQTSGNGLFNSTPAVSSFGSGNSNGAKPFSFGANSTTGFGSTSNTGTSNAFGSTPINNGGSLFGQGTTNANNSGPFGQNTAQNTGSTPGLTFGSANTANAGGTNTAFSFGNSTPVTAGTAPKPFSFGTPANTTSTFGSAQNTANNKAFSFGNSNTASSGNGGTGLFGGLNQNANNASSNGTSLFGGGGFFGTNNNTNNSNTNNALAAGSQAPGATPNSLFGKANTNLFSSTNTNTPSSGLFSQQPTSTTQSSNLFGNSTTTGGQFQSMSQGPPSQNLSLSIANNAYGNNPLFSSLQGSVHNSPGSPGPLATPLTSTSVKKKPAALPHFKMTTSRSPAIPKFLSYKANASLSTASPQSQRRHVIPAFDEELLLNPEAFSPRSTLKRLVIDREANDSQLLTGGVDIKGSKAGPPPAEHDSSKVYPDTVKEPFPPSKAQASTEEKSSSPATDKPSKPENSDQMPQSGIKHSSRAGQNEREKTDESYWTSPSLSTLLDYSKAELSSVPEFKVGRRGFGQITFCTPVDLSSLERVEDLVGGLILFENKMCTVYPDESMKPARGKGLNVPAIITLEKCFPLSKDKREPIRDPEHPRFHQHIDRLKKMSGTEFVDYLAESGTWIFKVEHF